MNAPLRMASLSVCSVALPREARKAIRQAVRRGMEPLQADPPQNLSEWAEDHFQLAGESSHQKGTWESWPFQIGIMDAFSSDAIEQVDVQKSKRVGYTKMVTAYVAYNIAHRRRKQALWQPTDDDRDSYVKSEIDPILDLVPAVRAMRRSGKGTEDTIKLKTFRGSVLHLLGGKAARAYRRITVAVSILDELDGFDQQVEKSSDPMTLARGRLEGAPYPKLVAGTTPRIKGLSHIERSRLQANADLRYHITCPHCGVDHPLMWGGKKSAHGFKWEEGNPASVRHVCPHCHESITQGDYLRNWVGAWVCERTGLRYGADRTWRKPDGAPCRPPRHIAFRIWAAYSPQRTWESIVREFLAAKQALEIGDAGPMQGWVNETLGETWELQGEKSDEHALQARAEPFPLGIVPCGVLLLTQGIDVQGNRVEIATWGWARGRESWTIDHHVIEMNPQAEEDWDMVEAYITRRFVQAWHGGTMAAESTSIDANYQTQAVLNFVRRMRLKGINIHAVRGEGDPTKPIKGPGSSQDVTWRGQKFPQGVKLWQVGTKQAKDLLHGELNIEKPGRGFVHFSFQLPREWYEQLTAEQRVIVTTPTGMVERWIKRRPRNEVLDTRNYATHAYYMLDAHRWTEAKWDQREQMIQPSRDLFSAPDQAAPQILLEEPINTNTAATAATEPAPQQADRPLRQPAETMPLRSPPPTQAQPDW